MTTRVQTRMSIGLVSSLLSSVSLTGKFKRPVRFVLPYLSDGRKMHIHSIHGSLVQKIILEYNMASICCKIYF